MKLTKEKNNFSSGLLSESLSDRHDLDVYKSGCSVLENFMTDVHGGIKKRSGFEFLYRTRYTRIEKMVPFQFSSNENFIAVFYRNDIVIVNDGNIVSNSTRIAFDQLNLIEISTLPRGSTSNKIITGYTQSLDILVIFFEDHEPYIIARKYVEENNQFFYIPYRTYDVDEANLIGTEINIPSNWEGTNWPRNGVFFQNRLWMTSTANKPQTIWATKTGNFFDFTKGSETDDGLEFTISDDNFNEIKWIIANKSLIMGTENGEFILSATDFGDPITPNDVSIVRYSSFGSEKVKPIILEDVTLFLQLGSNILRQFQYDYTRRSYVSNKISIAIKDEFKAIKDIQLINTPNNIVFCLTDIGDLYCCLIENNEEILSWFKIKTTGKITNICSLREGDYHTLYVSVLRDDNNSQYEVLERFVSNKEIFLDSYLEIKSDILFSTIINLYHLRHQKVLCVHSKGIETHIVNSTGQVPLATEVNNVIVGLPFISKFQSMNIQKEQSEIDTKGSLKRIMYVVINVLKSLSLKIGTDENRLENVEFRNQNFQFDSDLELFSGYRKLSVEDETDYDSRIFIVSEDPYNCHILSLVYFVNVNEV